MAARDQACFRVIARKNGRACAPQALARLRASSCIIDGEALACGEDGIANFDRIRYRQHDASVFLYAFDLLELNGDDLRRDPLNVRKARLASVLACASSGLRFNEHLDGADGPLVFQHACKLGLEGIVSKRRDSSYRSWRTPDWIKSKKPKLPAVKREAEEGLGRWETFPPVTLEKVPSMKNESAAQRIRMIRSRVREERQLVSKLNGVVTDANLRRMLRLPVNMLDRVETFFLNPKILQEDRSPAALARWLREAERILQLASQQRKSFELIIERFGPDARLISG